jgi:phosphoribosylanthranilate isomerase
MWIKICGLRDVATAIAVCESEIDAIGLNFYTRSSRHVPPETARQIVQALPSGVEAVGLFVNHPVEEIERICALTGVRTVQLHGDESPEAHAAVTERGLKVLRAFRVGAEGLGPMAGYLNRCAQLGAVPAACLVDSRVEGTYGGTGQVAPWDRIRRDFREDWPPLILAGGLTPENVAEAIEAVRPWGIDVAGGVESSVACKDIARVRDFVHRARSAAR